MEKTRKSYFDIDESMIEKSIFAGGIIDEVIYYRDLLQRKITLNDDICQDTISDVVAKILQYNADDVGIPTSERKPILLYIASNGGEVDSGFELIDIIGVSKTPIYTINLGYQYSMGFLIGLAGHKRFALKNSKFLLHDGSSFVYDSGGKAQDRMEFNKVIEKRIKDFVLKSSKITEESYDKNLRIEWYFFSDEAKELGVTDYIIGEDCDIDIII